MELSNKNSFIKINSENGCLEEISLINPEICFLKNYNTGLFEINLPLPEYPSHKLTVGVNQLLPEISKKENQIVINYQKFISLLGEFSLPVFVYIKPYVEGGFVLKMEITNNSRYCIPQVLFPNFNGFVPTGGIDKEFLYMGRKKIKPYQNMVVPDKAVKFYDLYRKFYFPYQMGELCFKWCDLGNEKYGITIFSKDISPDVQGIYLEKNKEKDVLQLKWCHYPHIKPGEKWVSPDFIVYPHSDNWIEGAKIYKNFITSHFKTSTPTKYLKDTFGFRTLFFSTYSYSYKKPNFYYRDLPKIAEDCLKHGIKEIVMWFWSNSFFPPKKEDNLVNKKLGTEEELKQAISFCKKMGVNVVAFISARAVWGEGIENITDEWLEMDFQGHKRAQFYTYDLDFVPPFNPPHYSSGVSYFACVCSKNWQKSFVNYCEKIYKLGFSSICFDQIFANNLCYNKEHNHKPQQTGYDFYQVLKKIISKGKEFDTDATFSGEYFTEITQTFQHYNWDWNGGAEITPEEFAPFRYVFPKFRISFLVDRSQRWLLEAFTHGLYINFFPEDGEGLIGNDKEFSQKVRQLFLLKQKFIRFFEEGQYYGSSPIKGKFTTGCVYQFQQEILIILSNSKKEVEEIDIYLDLTQFLQKIDNFSLTVYNLIGEKEKQEKILNLSKFKFCVKLLPLNVKLLLISPTYYEKK